jgi:hypothetical protein
MRDEAVELPVALAAQQLRQSRERVVRMILTGRLEGRQKDGRWLVSLASLERLRRAPESHGTISRTGLALSRSRDTEVCA